MISRSATTKLIATSLLIAAFDIILAIFQVFGGSSGWLNYAIIGLVSVTFFAAALVRMRERTEHVHVAKSARDSFLKHKWEQRYRREW